MRDYQSNIQKQDALKVLSALFKIDPSILTARLNFNELITFEQKPDINRISLDQPEREEVDTTKLLSFVLSGKSRGFNRLR